MKVIDQITANFKFATDILRRLGEELNPNPSQGIIELVKNSYDADAKECKVELIDVGSKGGKIIITDDGSGMEADDIIQGWLVLGKSKKDQNNISELGRRQVGNKGLGRLAALRLGTKTSLTSVSKKNTNLEYSIDIDWDAFDKTEIVEDVVLTIQKVEHEKRKVHGAKIYIENLRSSVTKNEAKKLARAMILLADPFGDKQKGFSPILKSEEFKELERLVEAKYFKDSEYHLVAETKDGIGQAKVIDHNGGILYKASHAELRRNNKNNKYNCPTTKFDLWIFILDEPTFSTRITTLTEIKDWLNYFGGVHIYHNGIRVSPYGDIGNDWLGLNLMRVKSPELVPSTNTSIGRVIIDENENLLVQKTDRSGFIENDVFDEIRIFATDALKWLQRERLKVRESKRAAERTEAPTESEKTKQSIQSVISMLSGTKKEKIEKAFQAYDKTKEKEIGTLKREVQLYRTLSTVGITSSVFAHESANNPIKVISQTIRTIRTRAKQHIRKYEDFFEKPIARIISAIESIRVLANVTLSLVDHEKRRASRVEIHNVLENVVKLYEPFIEGREAHVDIKLCDGNPYLRGSQAALESIVSNLLNNSLYFFEKSSPKDRLIRIVTKQTDEQIEIRVADNGPGIVGIDKKEIWLPGQTTKPDGTGLGLAIVKDAVLDLGGKVDAIEKCDIGGAEIIITLPILGL